MRMTLAFFTLGLVAMTINPAAGLALWALAVLSRLAKNHDVRADARRRNPRSGLYYGARPQRPGAILRWSTRDVLDRLGLR